MGWSGKYGESLTFMAPFPDLPPIDGLLIFSEGLREQVEPIFQNHHETEEERAYTHAMEILDVHTRNDKNTKREKTRKV